MPNRNKELLYNLELRIKQLMFLCDSLKDENSELKKRLLESEKIKTDLDLKLKQLTVDYDSLRFANSFVSGKEKEDAKQKLSELVQDVDKCISLLKF